MNWFQLIMMIVQFILGRIQPAPSSFSGGALSAYAHQHFRERKTEEIARAMCYLEPQLKFECVMQVLPDALEKAAAHVRAHGIDNLGGLFSVAIDAVAAIVKCQFSGGTATQAIDPNITNKVLTCGISAFFAWLQNRDIGAAISSFFSCVLSGNGNSPPPGDGGGNGNNPPPDGGIDPKKPTFRDVPGSCG